MARKIYLKQLFTPKPTISDDDINTGLRWMTFEGMATLGFWSIVTSGFLAAFALALGANNFQIGVLAALPFLTQPVQILAIPLIEKIKRRKIIAVAAWIPAQLLWIPIALIPVYMNTPGAAAISMLLVLIGFRGILVAVGQCAWNSMMKDLIPQKILGSAFARRLMLAGIVGVFFALSASFFVDHWHGGPSGEEGAFVYTIPLLFGVLTLALGSPLSMALTPEPLMQTLNGSQSSLMSNLVTPFRDRNYRHLLRFLFLWGLALNLAIPFFAVYMLTVLNLSLAAVIGFTTLSQATNIIFLGVWGRFADRFGSKVILSLSASLYLLVIFGWTFTTMPDRYFFTLPLLAILHLLAGIASAGVTLTTGTIGMKLAPTGQATPYLAAAAIATNIGTGIGPLLGGLFADFFSVRSFTINLEWTDPSRTLDLSALHLTGFDFLFGLAFIMGIFTINTLTSLREEGEVSREIVLEALASPMRNFARPMSSVPGLNFFTQFPFGFLRRSRVPGVDVALGVTAYQIANTAKVATETALRGHKLTSRITKSIEEDLTDFLEKAEGEGTPGIEATRHAVRGAFHAIGEAAVDISSLSHNAIVGISRAMKSAGADPHENLRGSGQGVILGAIETGADIRKTAQGAMKASYEVAHQVGLTEDAAAATTAKGMLEAAEAAGPEVIAMVKEGLPEEFQEVEIEQVQEDKQENEP
ncbi:MAG: MFS transporter [Chloroflexota bacterium]|nr:MFS transporter [Chloroflexota bacterium]